MFSLLKFSLSRHCRYQAYRRRCSLSSSSYSVTLSALVPLITSFVAAHSYLLQFFHNNVSSHVPVPSHLLHRLSSILTHFTIHIPLAFSSSFLFYITFFLSFHSPSPAFFSHILHHSLVLADAYYPFNILCSAFNTLDRALIYPPLRSKHLTAVSSSAIITILPTCS